MTLTIIARNPYTGQIGFAMASGSDDCVGGSIAADSKTGIFSLQAKGDKDLRADIFDHLKSGVSARDCFKALVAKDSQLDLRQILILPPKGEGFCFTGRECLKWAGHLAAENYILGGNMLANDTVLKSMEKAFLSDMYAPLHKRLFSALKAGVVAGGDIRGHKSCGLMVYGPRPFECQVENHDSPLAALESALIP